MTAMTTRGKAGLGWDVPFHTAFEVYTEVKSLLCCECEQIANDVELNHFHGGNQHNIELMPYIIVRYCHLRDQRDLEYPRALAV